MSATRLLVLGVVRMHGQAHGYQVRRDLLTWSVDKWANVQPGSIYHALKQMAKEGLLEQADAEGGPGRTVYQLTPDGETEFQVLLAKGLVDTEQEVTSTYNFLAAFTFVTALPRKRAISLLRHRVTQLTGHSTTLRNLIDESADWGQPAHISQMYRFWLARLEATIGWTEDLVERLETGEYLMADDGPEHFGACSAVIKLD